MIIVLKQLGFTLQEIQQLATLEKKSITPDCNQSAMTIFNSKLQQLNEKLDFYNNAIQTLEFTKVLMEEGKYKENKLLINQSITELFNQVQFQEGKND